MHRSHWSAVLVVLFTACSGSDRIVVPEQPSTPSLPAPAPILRLALRVHRTEMRPQERQLIVLDASNDNGTPILETVPPTWTSSDPTVVSVSIVDGRTGDLTALSPGEVSITATFGGKTVSAGITVLRPIAPPSAPPIASVGGFEVESFSMVEFQYPSAPGRWFYAPLMRVRARDDGNGAAITLLDFEISGFGSLPVCNAFIHIGPGGAKDLFLEIYGDYQLAFFHRDGTRATGTSAQVVINVRDGAGIKRSLTVTGPIVSGALPTTYTGRNPEWLCQFG
jgi:hypothetical protein